MHWCARRGFSLAELVAALALTGLLAALLCGLLLTQLRLARHVATRAQEADAVRTARTVLDGEARRMTAADVRSVSTDSLALRAFRGAAVPCGSDGTALLARYRGDRLPDPGKDSLLVITAGAATAVPLADARAAAGPCILRPGEQLLALRAAVPADAAVLLVFESGSYFLAARALRYRLGAEGRQPLTAEAFLHPGTRFDGVNAGSLRFSLHAGGSVVPTAAPFAGGPP